MDLGMESDEDENAEQARLLVRNPVLFDASHDRTPDASSGLTPMPHAAQAVRDRDAEDVWAELG
jgi:hypothetical protein